MPETMVNRCGSRPTSTSDSLNVLRMLKLPQPGHHAGVKPPKSAIVDMETSLNIYPSTKGNLPFKIIGVATSESKFKNCCCYCPEEHADPDNQNIPEMPVLLW